MSIHVMVPLGSGSPKPFVPASVKQTGLIKSLLGEKEVPGDYRQDILVLVESGELSKSDASAEITYLFKQPKAAKSAGAKASSVASVEDGFYWHEAEQNVYKVVKSKTGNQYAKVMVLPEAEGKKGSWVYAPGAIKQAGQWVKIDGTVAASIGKLIGHCCACGALLTDPKSIEAGIGPICAGKF